MSESISDSPDGTVLAFYLLVPFEIKKCLMRLMQKQYVAFEKALARFTAWDDLLLL